MKYKIKGIAEDHPAQKDFNKFMNKTTKADKCPSVRCDCKRCKSITDLQGR